MCSAVLDAIKPIYEDLSKDALPERCIGSFTQNNNEINMATGAFKIGTLLY